MHQIELLPASPWPAGSGRACLALDDVRWPVIEQHRLQATSRIRVWCARLNSLDLARNPAGAGWCVGLHVSSQSLSPGSGGRGWGALPRWGVYRTRAEALRAARAAVENEGALWPDAPSNRAVLDAWRALFDRIMEG